MEQAEGGRWEACGIRSEHVGSVRNDGIPRLYGGSHELPSYIELSNHRPEAQKSVYCFTMPLASQL